LNVAIYVYDQAEVLDFSGPFEVFTTASRVADGRDPFTTFLVGESGEPVTARGGYRVIPAYGFHHHPRIDLLIVAGGVHDPEVGKTRVVRWISRQARGAQIVASVCTGAFLLAEAGLLAGHRVTTHWEDIPVLRQMFPGLEVVEGVRWVDEGKLVTSGGIAAGIEMSLRLVARLCGDELAARTARQMDFPYTITLHV